MSFKTLKCIIIYQKSESELEYFLEGEYSLCVESYGNKSSVVTCEYLHLTS